MIIKYLILFVFHSWIGDVEENKEIKDKQNPAGICVEEAESKSGVFDAY